MNPNDINSQVVNTDVSENPAIQTNNIASNEQATAPVKKKKYWLIPILVLAAMILSLFFVLLPGILKIAFDINIANNGLFTLIRMLMIFILGLCVMGFIPSIIIAIVLSSTNKKK